MSTRPSPAAREHNTPVFCVPRFTVSEPTVATGDAAVLADAPPPRIAPPPTILGPWLATGLGLAALVVVPNDGATSAAGAATPQIAPVSATADAFVSFRSSLAAVVPLPDTDEAPISSEAALTLDHVQTPASANQPPNTEHPFAVQGVPIRPLPEGYSHPLVDPAAAIGYVAPYTPSEEQWAALRFCESSGNYQAINPTTTYRGAYQFDVPTWESVGGTGDPAAASPEEQDLRAKLLYESRGSSPWPFCGKFLEPENG